MYYWKILCGWIAWRPPKFPRYRTEKWPEGLQDDGLDSRLKKRNNFFVKMDPTQVNNRVSMQLAFTFSFLYLVGKTAINSACFERRKRVDRNVYSVSLKIAMTRIYLGMQGWCYSLIYIQSLSSTYHWISTALLYAPIINRCLLRRHSGQSSASLNCHFLRKTWVLIFMLLDENTICNALNWWICSSPIWKDYVKPVSSKIVGLL